jgi:hypothetical protein
VGDVRDSAVLSFPAAIWSSHRSYQARKSGAEETLGPQKPSAFPMSTRPARGRDADEDQVAAAGLDDVEEQVAQARGGIGAAEPSRTRVGVLGGHREEHAVLQRQQPVERGGATAAQAKKEAARGRGKFHLFLGLEGVCLGFAQAGSETEPVPLLAE